MKKSVYAVLLLCLLGVSCALQESESVDDQKKANASFLSDPHLQNYSQVYFRGTANAWNTSPMTLTGDYTWEINQTFGSTGSERFKFDIYGDWRENYGDNNSDGIADRSGEDISVQSGQNYRIVFNGSSKEYYAFTDNSLAHHYPQVHLRSTANNWQNSPMTLVDDFVHAIDVTFADNGKFKFDVYGDWSKNFGDNDSDGTADYLGDNILISQGAGEYHIEFNDVSKRYSVTKTSYTLSAPVNVTVSETTEESLTIRWDSVPGANSYQVYRSTSANGPYEPVRQIEIRYETDWALTYLHYRPIGGSWSSLPGDKMTQMDTEPAFKSIILDNVSDLEFVFNDQNGTWDNNSGQNYTINGEGIYQVNADHSVSYVSNWDRTTASFTDSGLTPMTTYYYKVKALNQSGDSPLSESVSGKTSWLPLFGPWLTLFVPTAGYDDEVTPLDPRYGVTVHYRTVNSTTGKVTYRQTQYRGTGTPWTIVTSSQYDGLMHHVSLTGLEADTAYDYKVYGSSDEASQVYTFKTAPVDSDDLTFIVLGDMQDGGGYGDNTRRWEDVSEEIYDNHKDVDFLVIVGDMASDDYFSAWKTFFLKGKKLFASKVMMPIIGNHDAENHSSDSFKYYFNLKTLSSSSKSYFAYQYGPAYFMGLNSEREDQFSSYSWDDGRQYDWIKTQTDALKAMPAAAKPHWVFTYWHKPAYDIADFHRGEQGLFRPVTEHFDNIVDWCFTGHEHLYHRFKPIRWNGWVQSSYGTRAGQGVGYMTLPPAGNEPRTDATPDSLVDYYVTTREIGFTRVEISGSSIDLTTWFMGGFGKHGNIVPAHPEPHPVSYSK